MRFLKRISIFWFVSVVNTFQKFFISHPSFYKILLAPGGEAIRWRLSAARAWYMYEYARKYVPAYKKFALKSNAPSNLLNKKGKIQVSLAPESDKSSYVKEYPLAERCVGGIIPSQGVTVDESSGSTGEPTNWLRSYEERMVTKHMLQLAYRGTMGKEPFFVLNGFVLGAWATGMIVSQSLLDICIMKSTGADAEKIIRTIKSFGPSYHYIIMGYPPFLKSLIDDIDLDWKKYRIDAIFGGEAISEPMRDYLLKYYKRVIGSYGASDLEINIGSENATTIALRKALITNKKLRARIVKEYGSIPMIFQYNPLAYYIESNEAGELVVTINRPTAVLPKIRYNIHDRGHVMRFKELRKILKEEGELKILENQHGRVIDLPLLFHYGRSDMSVEFFGANVTPEGARQALFGVKELAPVLESFRLQSLEDKNADKHMKICIELKKGTPNTFDNTLIAEKVYAYLADINGDFGKMLSFAPAHLKPTVEIFEQGQGMFKDGHKKIKHTYVDSAITYDEMPA